MLEVRNLEVFECFDLELNFLAKSPVIKCGRPNIIRSMDSLTVFDFTGRRQSDEIWITHADRSNEFIGFIFKNQKPGSLVLKIP